MRPSRACAFLGLGATLLVSAAPRPSPQVGSADPPVARLAAQLRELLARYPWRGTRWSVLVVSLDQGDTLFSVSPDTAMAPASNMKLLTSAAALRELGPDFRFRTWLLSDGPVGGGVLRGDLVLFGSGDPGISDRFYPRKESVFEGLADQLAAQGIVQVTGDIVGDASFFSGPLRPLTWDREDLDEHFAAPVGALSFNENVVTVRVAPAARAGEPPSVSTWPERAGLAVNNRAMTTLGPGTLRIARDDPAAPVSIRGEIQLGAGEVWREITVSEPAAYAAAVFREVLKSRGIEVLGGIRVVADAQESLLGPGGVTAPAVPQRRRVRVLARHVSPPLREYLAVVNKKSNNIYTELIFRTLGRVTRGTGSPDAAAAAVSASLAALGVNLDGVVQLDGSGLSAANRAKASTFVDLLSRMASSPEWLDYWASLPVAGNRRELGRMYDTPAAGNLRAKTGTIEGVSALSGVVQTQDGERLAFSILVNGTPSSNRAKRVENEIGVRLASFQRGTHAPATGLQVRLPPAPVPPDSGGPARHRVAPGETLHAIAQRYRVTLEELLRANPGVQPDRLRAGTWVIIPPAGSGAGGTPRSRR